MTGLKNMCQADLPTDRRIKVNQRKAPQKKILTHIKHPIIFAFYNFGLKCCVHP